MGRIRSIKPSAFNSADFCALTPLARCLFFALLCEADREGRLEWSPENLKLRYLPADPKADVDQLGAEMVKRAMLVLYDVDGKWYAAIPNFLKHQRPNNREPASLIPPPKPSSSLEGNLVEGEGNGKGSKDPPTPLTGGNGRRQRKPRTAAPESFTPSAPLLAWMDKNFGPLDPKQVELQTAKFLDHHRAKSNMFADWDAAWRTWITNWKTEFGKVAPGRSASPSYARLS